MQSIADSFPPSSINLKKLFTYIRHSSICQVEREKNREFNLSQIPFPIELTVCQNFNTNTPYIKF